MDTTEVLIAVSIRLFFALIIGVFSASVVLAVLWYIFRKH